MQYRVTSPRAVHGYAPGETFEAEFTEAQEARLIANGLIERTDEGADEPDESGGSDTA